MIYNLQTLPITIEVDNGTAYINVKDSRYFEIRNLDKKTIYYNVRTRRYTIKLKQ